MKLINIVSRLISFSIFTYFNNSLVENFSINSVKNIAFLFLESILLLFFLSVDDERDKKYREVCSQNINFYNQMLKLQDTIDELHKEKKEIETNIRKKFQATLLEYQKNVKKCIFPFCINDIPYGDPMDNKNNICNEHSKYKTDECVICFEKFEENDYPLKCGHWIHDRCLKLTEINKCSLCKEENIYF